LIIEFFSERLPGESKRIAEELRVGAPSIDEGLVSFIEGLLKADPIERTLQ